MPMGQRGGAAEVAVVAVWKADESSSPTAELLPLPAAGGAATAAAAAAAAAVKIRRRAAPRVERVPLQDPRKAEDAMPSLTAPGTAPLMDATVYDLEAHPDAIAKALDDSAFQSLLLESAARFVERENEGVVLDRGGNRRCYTHRADATPRTAAAAAAAEAGAYTRSL